MLREIVTDFVLFSGIEGFIFCLFFEKVGECRRFKWYEWLILSIGNCLISQLLPPTLYQFVCVLWMSVFVYSLNRQKTFGKILKSILLFIFGIFIVEIIGSIILEYGFNYNRFPYMKNDIISYISFIIFKIIELIMIYILYKYKRKEG